MIDESIRAVKEAEAKGEKMISEAMRNAEEIKEEAEKKAQKIRADAETNSREREKTALLQAEQEGGEIIHTAKQKTDEETKKLTEDAYQKKEAAIDGVMQAFFKGCD